MKITHNITTPLISASSNHAFPLSILSDREAIWYFAQSIQLYGHKEKQTLDIFEYHNVAKEPTPFVSISSLSLKDRLVDEFLIESLRAGFYIRLYLDQYYLQYQTSFSRSSKTNDILIYGYDSSKETFMFVAVNKNGMLERKVLHKKHICNAYVYANPQESSKRNVYLYKAIHHSQPEIKNMLNEISSQLKDYLNSKDCIEIHSNIKKLYPSKDYAYGLDNYKLLIQHLKAIGSQERELNIKNFQILVEHKYIIQFIVREIHKLGLIDKSYIYEINNIVIMVENLKKSVLRYMLRKNERVILGLVEKIKDIQEKEIQLLQRVLKRIGDSTCI